MLENTSVGALVHKLRFFLCQSAAVRNRVITLSFNAQWPFHLLRVHKFKSLIAIKYILWPYCFILVVFSLLVE